MRILAVRPAVAMLALAGAAAAGSRSPFRSCWPAAWWRSARTGWPSPRSPSTPARLGRRALGIQNTGQNALAAATPPVLALAIGSIGFGGSFAVVAAFPLVAAAIVPVASARLRGGAGGPATAYGIRS